MLIANGVFAMAEIAVVSARKAKLRQFADGGDARARAALDLTESPNRFLATVQIGITLVGIIAGAFGGATIAEKLSPALKPVLVMEAYANAVGFGVVITAITYHHSIAWNNNGTRWFVSSALACGKVILSSKIC